MIVASHVAFIDYFANRLSVWQSGKDTYNQLYPRFSKVANSPARRIKKPDEFVTELAKAACHLPAVASGSVLVAITGEGKTLGNAALVEFDTCVSQHLAYVQFHRFDVVPAFLLYYLQRQYAHLRQMSVGAGSTKKALTCGLLKRYQVPVPEEDEQKLIATAFDAIVLKINGHERTVACLRALFRTFLHQLMTAEIRVADLDLSRLAETTRMASMV
jgi:type I restriction enzyme S subunit